MKNVFLGLVFATSLVASAYSYGCQQRYNNRHVRPLVDIAPKWTVHFPSAESFWDHDFLDDPWHTFDRVADDAFGVFRSPIQEEPKTKPTQCKSNGVETPLDDAQIQSNAKIQNGEQDNHRDSSSQEYDDWSEEAELLRRQEWEKKLQQDIQKEQHRREEWYQEKVSKVRKEQEDRERLIAQERQRQHDLIRNREEEILKRQEEMRKKRQEMEENIKREKWLEEKRREEEKRQEEERARKQQEARRVQEELRRKEAERQERIQREQWLERKRMDEQQRQMEELRRKEEQRAAEERLRILEEKQRAKQRELEEKIRLQQEQAQLVHERQQQELKRKREQFAEGQQRQQHHDFQSSRSFSTSTQHHNNPHHVHSHGSESIVFDMLLSGYYPADLSVKVQNGILHVEGSHVCGCEEECFMREFERKAAIPTEIDTESLSASLDSEGHFKVTGIQYSHPVQQSDVNIPVTAVHIPNQMPAALKYCPEKKPTYKLAKIDPLTGSTHKRNAYKFERRKTQYEDDGVTIEVADDFA